MKPVNINIEEQLADRWEKLPQKTRQSIASKALNALLKGSLYPTGPEQLELAIELAEAGVDTETISQLTHLDKELFENFM